MLAPPTRECCARALPPASARAARATRRSHHCEAHRIGDRPPAAPGCASSTIEVGAATDDGSRSFYESFYESHTGRSNGDPPFGSWAVAVKLHTRDCAHGSTIPDAKPTEANFLIFFVSSRHLAGRIPREFASPPVAMSHLAPRSVPAPRHSTLLHDRVP